MVLVLYFQGSDEEAEPERAALRIPGCGRVRACAMWLSWMEFGLPVPPVPGFGSERDCVYHGVWPVLS